MHCGASVSELYGVLMLCKQLHIYNSFQIKALPPKVLIVVEVYTSNEII